MKSLKFNKLRNYTRTTAIGLILAAVTGCTSVPDMPPITTPDLSNLTDLLGTNLDAGRKKLEERGYRLVESGAAAKELWWNEQSKACVSLKVNGQQIEAINGFKAAQCLKRIEAAGKAPAQQHKPVTPANPYKPDKPDTYVYSDGQAKVSSPDLIAERQQLAFQGYKAIYWMKDASSGKGAEYWLSADRSKCTALVFTMPDGTLISMGNAEPDQCVKPRP